ncbi:MAG TPA: cell division protein FtsL [Gammaproteobacteria bacterium]|nr:cell division protein FtsL [Gammaproteobacteria bacterium]
MNARLWFPLLLTLVIGSALTVVYVKHQSRMLFAELRGIQKQQDQQVIQWGRLQLQNTTLATHSNVESRARKDLKMRLPDTVELVRLR